ncbi:hypothetical protein [Rhodopseudomonas palustris]|uniref:Uncharacterized protein n=1 Tax=Rhodopseudomonas palustris (strain BisB18) TaxID=316056 RepID=Q21AL9_RHOPB
MTGRQDPSLPPPFVVWRRVDRQFGTFDPKHSASRYYLVPHAVHYHLLAHALVQSLGLFSIFSVVPAQAIPGVAPLFLWFTFLILFLASAMGVSALISAMLNGSSTQPISALLLLCSTKARREYESCFPSFPSNHAGGLIRYQSRLGRKIGPISQETIYWVGRLFRGNEARTRWPIKMTNVVVRRLRKCLRSDCLASTASENTAKLRSLELRREDSRLFALSAFAIVSCFVPLQRNRKTMASARIEFILSYLSPVLFGFALCIATFLMYPIIQAISPPASASGSCNQSQSLSKMPFMLCITLWFFQSLWYSVSTLKQDFSQQFKSYFNARPFPNSMTAFGNWQMSHAPDLVKFAEEKWLPALVATVITGLASLYAAFLQSLG